ncbi:UPF0235 protein C15orf40 homolog [Nilaparvata lugens]|uniref:UPF0235 protein C15orf40 homolog n=1 Tax=Nilaparvata lugens TaxID=108931 RepID=UPI00193E37D6|nr:UPF0235 protein C15orf40 homolog [Nilaparvata lugens]XP_039294191.1 UPF0235 protein C15orf40 homolog [Nilaparvata lugens]XP_039294192.1 UPF0235 protein C15orf40 homolog [Nilaparvata lugens]
MIQSRLLSIPLLYKMPKKTAKTKASADSDKTNVKTNKTEPVDCDKDGNILIHVHAKPGSKQNMIQGSETSSDDQPRLAVKIAARAVEGQANTELVEYLAEVLSVRKSDFTIVRGQKSREKTVSLSPKTLTLESARKKIEEEIARTKDAE